MWWRAPWLRQRWMLLSLAVFDSIAIVAVYNVLFLHKFGYWAGITGAPASISLTWVGFSYLFGRYSINDERSNTSRGNVGSTLLTTATTALTCTILVAVVSWAYNSEDPRAFRSFVAPAAIYGSALSYLGQQLKRQAQKSEREASLIIAPEEEISVISKENNLLPASQRLRIRTSRVESQTPINDQQINGAAKCKIVISEKASISDSAIRTLLQKREHGEKIQNLITWCEDNLQRVPPELLSGQWLVLAEGFGLRPGSSTWRIKRLGDIVVAGLLLAVTLPIVAIAALGIAISDRGPVFYSQLRTGLNGAEFKIWKLRTMVAESEKTGPQWAQRNDPRITKIGYWLRKTRIDELPQLISVIRGEMSLIGPRPERPEIEKNLEQSLPHYRIRHWIRPGLSGWAQVCYPYGASLEDSRQKLSYDIFYLRNAGISLDFLILIKTIRLVLFAKGSTPRLTEAQQ